MSKGISKNKDNQDISKIVSEKLTKLKLTNDDIKNLLLNKLNDYGIDDNFLKEF